MELQKKIEANEERLLALQKKRDNIDREIRNLENKIYNQRDALRRRKEGVK